MNVFSFHDKEFEQAYDKEVNEINAQLEKEIVFAMIGDVNAGKSSTINMLMGDEVAKVGAQPGETSLIEKYAYTDKIIFADTPGLDDINQKNSAETMKFYREADVILFFLNAAGTVFSEGERKTFEEVRKINQNIIFVLNKIDAAEDIPGLVKYIQDHTNYRYKVTPISSKTGENMEMLRGAILDILKEKKKDILFAKHLKEKSSTANKWIIAAAGSSTAIGASPIPGSDMVPLTAIQVGMMVKLATLYDKPLTKNKAKELTIATLTGNVGKTLFRQIVKLVPGAGMAAGASIAGGMTLALGYAIKYAYENDIDLDPKSLSKLYEMFSKKKEM
ncbi:GTPase [Bacillus sp. SLBN-3]